jgi:hypothetical protein
MGDLRDVTDFKIRTYQPETDDRKSTRYHGLEVFDFQQKMPIIPPPEMSLRSRREVNQRDQINSLHVEQWQTDGPYLHNDRTDPTRQKDFMDMNPIASRTVERNYLQHQGFVVSGALGDQLGNNPYFDKFDVTTDPYNVARELRATVYEEKADRGVLESQRLLNRTYTSRYLPEGYVEAKQLDTLKSYEQLMPRMNAMDKTYRKYTPT